MPQNQANMKDALFTGLENIASNPRFSWVHPIIHSILGTESLISPEKASIPPAFIDIAEYSGPEKRLQGFQKIAVVAEQMADSLPLYGARIRVINPKYFEAWNENNGQLPKEYEEQLRKESAEFLASSPNKSVAVRRSFFSSEPGIPGGPTHNDLQKVEDIFSSIAGKNGFFAYAKENNLHLKPDAIITAFEQDWIDPPDLVAAHGDVSLLPAGGNAYIETVNPDGGIVIKISSCLGDSSGIDKGHPEIDVHRVLFMPPDSENKVGTVKIINSKIYPQKKRMWLQRLTPPPQELNATLLDVKAKGQKDSPIYEVKIDPSTGVCQPLLTEGDVHRIATATGLLFHNSDGVAHKIEFTQGTFASKDGKGKITTVAILEAVPTTIPESNGKEISLHKGKMRIILSQEDDITTLESNHRDWKEEYPLVYLSHDLIRQFTNNTSLFDRIKQLGRRLTIVAPLMHTEHKARELESVHNLHSITATSADVNVMYEIKKRGIVAWIERYRGKSEKLKRVPRILTVEQAIAMGITQHEHIGGKGAGIANLVEHNYNAEQTIILSSTLFKQVIHANNLGKVFDEIKTADNQELLVHLFKRIHDNLKTFPRRSRKEIQDAITATFSNGHIFDGAISVRSDASFEDLRGAPFAGKLDTILDVPSTRPHELDEALLRVMRSYFKPSIAKAIFEDFAPRDRRLILNQLAGAIMIEPMIEKIVASGTLFGKEITGQKRHNIVVLQATLNQAGIVDGMSEKPALTIKFDRETRTFDGISVQSNGQEVALNSSAELTNDRTRNILTYKEVKSLILLAESMKHDMSDPQDAEWALTEDGIFHFLQARPL